MTGKVVQSSLVLSHSWRAMPTDKSPAAHRNGGAHGVLPDCPDSGMQKRGGVDVVGLTLASSGSAPLLDSLRFLLGGTIWLQPPSHSANGQCELNLCL